MATAATAEKYTHKAKTYYRGRWRCDGRFDLTTNSKSCRGHTNGLTFDQSGNRYRTVTAARKAAEAARDDAMKQLDPGDYTLRDVADEWLSQDREGLKESTRKTYRHVVSGFFYRVPEAEAVSPADVRRKTALAWMRKCRDGGATKSTLNAYRKALTALLKYAITDLEIIEANPVASISDGDMPKAGSKPKVVDWFTESELWMMADAMTPRYRLTVVLGCSMGLRIGEIAGLRESDIRPDADGDLWLHISRQFKDGHYSSLKPDRDLDHPDADTENPRVVPIPAHVVPLLEQHLQDFPPSANRGGALIANTVGNPMDYHNFIARDWKRALIAAGLSYRGTHSMRHTFATLALDAGIPVERVADLGGWKNVEMVWNVYRGKSTKEELKAHALTLSAPLTLTVTVPPKLSVVA